MEGNKVHTSGGPSRDTVALEATGLIGKDTQGSKEQLQDLMNLVQKRTTEYDPTLVENEEADKFEGEQMGYFHLIFKYADGKDKCTFFLACICATLFSASLPGFCVLFGEMLDGVGGSNTFDLLADQAQYMIYLGFYAFIFSSNLIIWYT